MSEKTKDRIIALPHCGTLRFSDEKDLRWEQEATFKLFRTEAKELLLKLEHEEGSRVYNHCLYKANDLASRWLAKLRPEDFEYTPMS